MSVLKDILDKDESGKEKKPESKSSKDEKETKPPEDQNTEAPTAPENAVEPGTGPAPPPAS